MPQMRRRALKLSKLRDKNHLNTTVRVVEKKCRSRTLLPDYHRTLEHFMHAIGRAKWLKKHPEGTPLASCRPGQIYLKGVLCSYPYNDAKPATMSTQITYEETDDVIIITRKPCHHTYPHQHLAYDAFGYVTFSVGGYVPTSVPVWDFAQQQYLLDLFNTSCQENNVAFGVQALQHINKCLFKHVLVPHDTLTNDNGSLDLIWETQDTRLDLNVACSGTYNTACDPVRDLHFSGYYRDDKAPGEAILPLANLNSAIPYLLTFCRGAY